MVLNSLVGRLLHAALLLSAGTAAARASLMDVIFYDNRFGTIDAATGSDTTISMLPIGKAAGIAQSNGSIYVEDLANNLLTVDPVTGASRALGNTGLGLNFVVFAGGDTGLFGIDYASNLYSFNSVNGAAALIGSTGISANNGQFDTSLSFDGSSLLYTAGHPGGSETSFTESISPPAWLRISAAPVLLPSPGWPSPPGNWTFFSTATPPTICIRPRMVPHLSPAARRWARRSSTAVFRFLPSRTARRRRFLNRRRW
jgi:hypothetical protein